MKFSQIIRYALLLSTSSATFSSIAWTSLTEQDVDEKLCQTIEKIWVDAVRPIYESSTTNLEHKEHSQTSPQTSQTYNIDHTTWIDPFESSLKPIMALANQGDLQSQLHLGFHYTLTKAFGKAFDYFKLAADQGNQEAQLRVAYGRDGLKDLEGFFKYCKTRADQGDQKAQFEVGQFHDIGAEDLDIPKSKPLAFHYYKLSADQGNMKAQFKVATFYIGIEHIEKNFEQAFYYYKLAADQGDKQAQYNVGLLYQHGRGVQQDLTKALYYLNLSKAYN